MSTSYSIACNAKLPRAVIASAPAVAVQADGGQDVFWQGADGNLWEAYYLNNRWNGVYREFVRKPR